MQDDRDFRSSAEERQAAQAAFVASVDGGVGESDLGKISARPIGHWTRSIVLWVCGMAGVAIVAGGLIAWGLAAALDAVVHLVRGMF